MALAHLPRRNTGDRCVICNSIYDHAACTYLGADANFDVAENLGSRSDESAAPYLGVPVAGLLDRPPNVTF